MALNKNSRIIDGVNMNEVKNIKYYAPKAQGQGGKFVYPKTKYVFRFPPMKTWGASDYKAEGEEVGNGKYKLALQFPNEDDDERTEELSTILENMKNFQEEIKNDLFVNSKEWFGKAKSKEVINETFANFLTFPKTNGEVDYSRAPSFRLKMPRYDNIWKFEMYDEDENKLYPNEENSEASPLDYIIKGSNVAVLFQYNGFFIINGNSYPSFNLAQIQVSKESPSLEGTCFLNFKKKDSQSQSPLENKNGKNKNENMISATIVYDSDDEVKTVKKVATVPVPVVVSVEKEKEVEVEVEKQPELQSQSQSQTVLEEEPVVVVEQTQTQVVAEEPKKTKRVIKKAASGTAVAVN